MSASQITFKSFYIVNGEEEAVQARYFRGEEVCCYTADNRVVWAALKDFVKQD